MAGRRGSRGDGRGGGSHKRNARTTELAGGGNGKKARTIVSTEPNTKNHAGGGKENRGAGLFRSQVWARGKATQPPATAVDVESDDGTGQEDDDEEEEEEEDERGEVSLNVISVDARGKHRFENISGLTRGGNVSEALTAEVQAAAGESRMNAQYMQGHIKSIVNMHVFPKRKFIEQDHPKVADDMQRWFKEITNHKLPWKKEAFGYMKAALSDRRSNVSNQMKTKFLGKLACISP